MQHGPTVRRLGIDAPLARSAAACVAAIAWAALALRTHITIGEFVSEGDTVLAGLVHLSRYFTIWMNLLAAVAMTAVALGRWPGGAHTSEAALAGVALYMALVGVVNHALLRGLIDFTGPERVADILLHYITPALTIAYWLAFAPKTHLAYRHAIIWLALPLVYGAVALLRGAASGKYPYPFLDVGKLGFERATMNAALMGLALFAAGVAVVAVARALSRRAVLPDARNSASQPQFENHNGDRDLSRPPP